MGGQSTNPRNTVNQLKRLLGKKFSDPHVQKDLEYFPFKVVAGPNGDCMFEVSASVAVAGRGGIPVCCAVAGGSRCWLEQVLAGRRCGAVLQLEAAGKEERRSRSVHPAACRRASSVQACRQRAGVQEEPMTAMQCSVLRSLSCPQVLPAMTCSLHQTTSMAALHPSCIAPSHCSQPI